MARLYETKHVPAKDIEVCVRRKCDLCGLESTKDDWDRGTYEVNDTEVSVTVKAREGTEYPDGGGGTGYEIDLCPRCFKGELVPWLIAKGANIKETEWDW